MQDEILHFFCIKNLSMRKVLIATEKPFAPEAIKKINKIFKKAGYKAFFSKNIIRKHELVKSNFDADAVNRSK